MRDELDRDLLAIFEARSARLPEEPFLGETLKLIEKTRSRRVLMRRLGLIPAIFLCAFLSPYLIQGSTMLSGGLNAVLEAVSGFIGMSPAVSIAVLCVLLFFNRRQISRLV